MKKRMQRRMVWAFIAALVMAALAGCGGDNTGKNGGSNVGSNAGSDGGTKSGANNEQQQGADPANTAPVELTVFSFLFGNAPAPDAPVYKAISDKLNIKLKFQSAPYDTYKDKLNVLIASEEMPDLFFHEGVDMKDIFSSWIKQDLLLPISDYSSSYPNIASHLSKFERLKKAEFGKHYGLPVINYDTDIEVSNEHAMFIRKDWLANLKLPMPTTIEEFYEVAKAFAEDDPDQNGKPDTYAMSGSGPGLGGFYFLVNAFNASADRFRIIDGKWTPEIVTEDGKAALRFLQQMYREKLIDPEFMVNNRDQAYQKFVSGKVGIIMDNATTDYFNGHYDRFHKAYPDANPLDMFDVIPVLVGKTGEKRVDGYKNFWGETSIRGDLSEEKRDAALRLLDYLLSEEGIEMMRWGIEGVHYKKEGDTYISLIEGVNDSGQPKKIGDIDSTVNMKTLATWDLSFIPADLPNREQAIAASADSMAHAKADALYYVFPDPAEVDPATKNKLWDYTVEKTTTLITSKGDFDSEWEAFVQGWLKLGQKYRDAMDAQAKAEQITE